MATKITDRAVKVAEGIIAKNNVPYRIWADFQVGQKVGQSYKNRYWLVLETKERKIITSTQKQAEYDDWMQLIAQNGIAA